MLIRGGGPKSGYVSTGFFSGKLLNNRYATIVYLSYTRSYIGSCYLIPHYGQGKYIYLLLDNFSMWI